MIIFVSLKTDISYMFHRTNDNNSLILINHLKYETSLPVEFTPSGEVGKLNLLTYN